MEQIKQSHSFTTSFVQTSDNQSTRSKYGGVSAKVLGTVNGKKVMIKSSGGEVEETLAEYFSSKLGNAIGIPVNEVDVIDCGDFYKLNKICSVHTWEDNLILAKSNPQFNEEHDGIRRFFDNLINNSDRHSNNYGMLNDDLFLIDNGLSSPWREFDEWERSSLISVIQHNMTDRLLKVLNNFSKLTWDDFKFLLTPPEHFTFKFNDDLLKKIIWRMGMAQASIKVGIKGVS